MTHRRNTLIEMIRDRKKNKTPAGAGVRGNPAKAGMTQADFLRGAALRVAGALVTVGLAPATAGASACARELP